jgi:hypothetical protein
LGWAAGPFALASRHASSTSTGASSPPPDQASMAPIRRGITPICIWACMLPLVPPNHSMVRLRATWHRAIAFEDAHHPSLKRSDAAVIDRVTRSSICACMDAAWRHASSLVRLTWDMGAEWLLALVNGLLWVSSGTTLSSIGRWACTVS